MATVEEAIFRCFIQMSRPINFLTFEHSKNLDDLITMKWRKITSSLPTHTNKHSYMYVKFERKVKWNKIK